MFDKPIKKRQRCLADKQLGEIAVKVFNNESTACAIAKQLGITPSYLSRLLQDARRRGVWWISVKDSSNQ